jgi:hypothetical protein
MDDIKNAVAVPEITDLDMAFGTTKGLPDYATIPDEFKRGPHNKWVKFVSEAFFSGAKNIEVTPIDGISPGAAFRHIKAMLASFEPRHEHKEAGAAFLMSQYFKDVSWERAK